MKLSANITVLTKSKDFSDHIVNKLKTQVEIENLKIISSWDKVKYAVKPKNFNTIIVDENIIDSGWENYISDLINNETIFILISTETSLENYNKYINAGFSEVVSFNNLDLLANIISRESIVYSKSKKTLSEENLDPLKEEYKYKELVKNLGEGIIIDRLIFDEYGKVIDWQILEVNNAYEQLVNLSSRDVVGKLGSEVYGKDEIEDILIIFDKVYKNRKEIKIPRYFAKTKQFFLTTVSPLKDDLVLVVFSNITELKLAQIALNDSELRLNLAVEGSQLGLWDQDFRTGKVYRNRYWASMLGYTLEEINSELNFWENLVHPNDIEKVKRVKDLHEEGEIPYFKVEHRLKTKDGNYKWVLNWGKISERDKNGKPLRAVGVHIDIDDRKKVTEELIQSQKKFKTIFDSTPLAIIAWESSFRITEWNNGAEYIFGWKKNEAIGKTFDELNFLGTNIQRIKQRILELRQGRKLDSIVVQNYTKSGDKIWCEWSDNALINDYGEITGFISTVSNITEKRENQLKLTRSEDLYRTLVETSPDGITMTDLDGNIIEVSPRIVEMYGYNSNQELIGKSSLDLIIRGERLKAISQMMRGIQTGKTEVREYKMLRKDGSTFYGELNTALIRDPGGNPSRIIGITRDITERKLNELALKISQSRVEFLTENIDDVIWTMNLNGEFTYISPSIKKLRGFTIEEAMNQTIEEAVTNDYADALKQQFAQFLEDPNKYRDYIIFEVDQPKKDGTLVKVELKVKALVDDDGKPVELLGVSRDISERVEANKKLLESEERFRIFMDHIPAGIFIKNEEGIYEFVNKYNEQELNVKDWQGKSAYDYFDKEIADKFAQEDQRILDGEVIMSNADLTLNDGSKKYFKTQYFPIISPTGRKFIGGISWDITNETFALNALKESEEKNRALSEATKEGLVFSQNGICIEANKAVCDLFGYEYDEIIGISGMEVVTEEFRDKVKQNILSNYEKPYEVLALRKDGTKFWAELEGRIYEYKGKNVIVTAVRDITEKKRFIDELEKSEENFRSIFENSAFGIFRSTPQGNIELANEALASILGYKSIQEMLSELKNMQKLYKHPEDRDKLMDSLAKQGFVNYREVEANHKQGKELWLSINAVASINPEGEVIYEGTMHDITERKKAQELLQESEEKYRSLFENQLEAYAYYEMIFDESGKPIDYKFIDINKEFLKNTGFSNKDEIIGKTYLQLWPDTDDYLVKIYGKVAQTGVPKIFERFATSFNKYFRVVAYSPRKGFFATSFLDITDQKLIENKLKESEEKFRTIVVSMDDIIYTLNKNEKHTGVYGKWTKEKDFRSDVFLGKTAKEIMGEEKGEIHHVNNQKALKGETVSYEWQVESGGNTIYYLTVVSPIYNTDNEIIGIVGVGRNITRLKDIELKLRESEAKYKNIFDNVQVGIYRTRLSDGKLIMANKKMASLFGYDSVEEALSDYVTSEHYVEENARNVILESLKEKGHFDNYDAALSIKNGDVRWFRYSGRLFEDEGYIEGVAIDITEQIEYQKELKNRNEFIQKVMDELPIGVALNKINDGFAFYINKKFEKIYGWPKKDLQDVNNFFQKVYPDVEYRNKIIEQVMGDISSRDPSKMHWENSIVTHKNGSKHIVNAQNIPLYEQNIMVSTVVDVTEQKEYEKKLRENEALLHAAFDNSQAGITIADVLEKKLTYMNKAGLEIIGLGANAKLRDLPVENYFSQWKIFKANGIECKTKELPLVRAVLNGDIVREEFIIRKEKREDRFIISHAAPINDESGKRIAAIEVFIDITERKLTEQKLTESELRYKTLVESSPDAIAIHVNNKIVFANSASKKLLQANSLNDIIGLDVKKIIHKDCLNEVRSRVNNIINKNNVYVAVEEKYLTLKGKEIDVEVTAVPIKFKNEKGVQVIIRDISERKRAEERIIFERNRTENYLETAAMMMLAIDKNGKVMMINRKGAEILGYTKNYIIGKSWVNNFIPEKSRIMVKQVLKKTLNGDFETFDYVENEVLCRYNKVKILGWHNSLLKDEEGKIIGTLSSAEDITESLIMQKEIERSREELQLLYQNLEKIREAERTELSREIHDDLGQSLTAIKIDLGSLKSDLPQQAAELRNKIDEIRSLVDSTINTVRKISTELRPGILDELGLSAAIEWQFEEFLKRNKVRGRLNVKPEEINLNNTISTAVFRVFQESLTNIARHSGASKVLVNLKLKENQLNLTIADDGVGIEIDKLNSIKSLGLIGMRERMNLVGGNIKIAPNKPKGTKISVTIPITG